MHCPSSRKGSNYLRLPQMFVALQLPLYYLEQLHQLANQALIKITSSERNVFKFFQKCDSYCLFTQINFKHVSELGNLTLERLTFLEVK